MKIHSIDEIPVIHEGSGWKYVTSTGYMSSSLPTKETAVKLALEFGGYELVEDEVAGPATVTKTQHFDGFQIDTYSDGTYGYMTDGGKHKEGYKSKDGAKKAATKLAAAEPKGPHVLKSEDKGGYVVNTFTDGTYGYLMPDGTFKNGYKSKDGAGKVGKKLAAKAAKAQEDAQAKLLEKQAQELQDKLQLTYADAINGMTSRIEASLKEFAAEDAKWQADVAAGKKDAKAYKAWRKDRALHDDKLKALKKALTQDLTAADKMAMAYVNQVPAGVYAEGMNFATYEIEHGAKANTSFTLYNKNTVMELVANEPDLLPQAAFDKAKDTAWNSRHVTSAVTQAVLQGQTVPQLATSIAGIAAMDQRAAMKAARTAITSAHSLGKLKGYERAADMGIDVKKQWLAALDSRTRGSHRHLDGETVKLDGEFSNGLKYPGDPDGPGSEVYNCRCTMVPVIGDVPYDEVERASKLGGMSYEEWKADKITKTRTPAGTAANSVKSVGTHEAFKSYMRDVWGVEVGDDFTGMSLEALKDTASGVEDALNEIPGLSAVINSFTTRNIDTLAYADGTIYFSKQTFADAAKLKAEWTRQVASGWTVPNASSATLGYHESAHAIEKLLIDRNPAYTSDADRHAAWNKTKESSAIVSQACKNVKKTEWGKGKKVADLKAAISRYAAANNAETFAEAFADCYTNGQDACPLSLEIKRLALEALAKYDGS